MGGEGEVGGLHSLTGGKFVGDFPQGPGWALHEDHFENMVVFQQNMLGGNDLRNVVTEDAREITQKGVFRFIIDESEGASHQLDADFPKMLGGVLVDHFRDGLGAAVETPFRDQPFKGLKGFLRHRDGHPPESLAAVVLRHA